MDLKHAWLDPVLVLGPWLATAGLGFLLVRRDREGERPREERSLSRSGTA